MDNTALVQVIKVEWTKSSRGGQGARDRNSVPSALAIPDVLLGRWTREILVNTTHWSEANAFAHPNRRESERLPANKVLRIDPVSIALGDPELAIGLDHETLLVRFVPVRREIVLMRGDWARVVFNARYACIDSGNWWYEQVTVNAGLFGERPPDSVFVETRPTTVFRHLSRLR